MINFYFLKVKWDKSVGISLSTHKEYIENFGNDFYEQTKRLIDRNQKKEYGGEKLSDNDTNLIREILDHGRFCKEKVTQFLGREDLLDKVNYIKYFYLL